VIGYFAAISDTIGPFQAQALTQVASTTSAGGDLFERLRCQQCHVLDTIPEDQPTDNLAPDLRMARERLQPDWILDWLRAPLEIQPGTRMPMFWTAYPESESAFDLAAYPQFNGDAVAQIQAIRDYMLTFSGGPRPSSPDTIASQD
jgi:cytochrome c2